MSSRYSVPVRKRRNYFPIIIAGGILAFTLVKETADATNLNWEIEDFNFNLSGGYIVIGVINPTSSVYTLQAVNCDILLNGNRIAMANYLGKIVIQGLAITKVKLALKLDPTGIAMDLFDEASQLVKQGADAPITQMQDKQTISVSGSANVDGLMIPVSATLGVFKI